MDKSLQRRLKSGDRSLRHSAMDELITIGNEEAFSTLQSIAEGRRRAWFRWYDFDDQRYALEAMLRTGAEESKNYLLNFFHEEVTEHNSLPWVDGNDVPIWAYELHRFPKARGTLGRRLTHTLTFKYPNPWGDGNDGGVVEHYYDHGSSEWWDRYKIIPYDKEAHRVRGTILSKISHSVS